MDCDVNKGKLPESPAYWRGAGACVLFAVVAVAVRGVRWDETWEHAQILTGQVVYPEGHPLALYVHNAFSLQTYISAGMLYAGAGPALVCGFRNVLFLLASLLPVYALTATLTRSVLAGLLAALLMMQGVVLEFDGSYPTMVWPETYSNGHIGGGVVLLALAALVAGRFRRAFFLLGLIPCIHVGQWPPLVATAGIFGVHALIVSKKEVTPRTVRWAGMFFLGLGVTVLFWVVHRQFALPLPVSGPFAAGGDTEAVWRGYTTLHDPHRRFPPGNGHVILAGTILLAWFLAVWGGENRLRRTGLGLALYTSIIGLFVWGTMAIHAVLGPDIPFLLIAWMPYRLINHVPTIALALAVGLILTRWPVRGWHLLAGAAIFGMLQPLWPWVVGETFHRRYLAGGECVAFALFGVALFAVAPLRGPGRCAGIVLTGAAIAPLAMYHRFGAACVVGGVAAGYIFNRVFQSRGGAGMCHTISPKGEFECPEQDALRPIMADPALPSGATGRFRSSTKGPRHVAPDDARNPPALHSNSPFGEIVWHEPTSRRLGLMVTMAVFAGCAALLWHQYHYRQHLPVSPFQMRVAENFPIDASALLVAPPDNLLLQATTNRPVLVEVATPSLISYVPSIGPAIDALYMDLYGITYRDHSVGGPWETVWRERGTAGWGELAERYGFTHVIAPIDLPLQLTEILADESYALYAVGR